MLPRSNPSQCNGESIVELPGRLTRIRETDRELLHIIIEFFHSFLGDFLQDLRYALASVRCAIMFVVLDEDRRILPRQAGEVEMHLVLPVEAVPEEDRDCAEHDGVEDALARARVAMRLRIEDRAQQDIDRFLLQSKQAPLVLVHLAEPGIHSIRSRRLEITAFLFFIAAIVIQFLSIRSLGGTKIRTPEEIFRFDTRTQGEAS